MKEPYSALLQIAEVIAPPPLPWLPTHPHIFVRKRPNRASAAQEMMVHLWPEMVRRSVPARRYEYVVGRLAAACLLASLDVSEGERWLISEGRRPIWPAGILGAISHTADLVAVTAGPRHADIHSVGIDVERLSTREEFGDTLALCFTDQEMMRLEALEYGPVTGFSAKESLFKCLSVEAGGYFDFLDAEIVAVDPVSQELDIRLSSNLSARLHKGTAFRARYRLVHGHVWTGVVWTSDPGAQHSSSAARPCASSGS